MTDRQSSEFATVLKTAQVATRTRTIQSGGGGEQCCYGQRVLDAHGIPADSITHALVVIPTNSRRNHSKSNSAVSGK